MLYVSVARSAKHYVDTTSLDEIQHVMRGYPESMTIKEFVSHALNTLIPERMLTSLRAAVTPIVQLDHLLDENHELVYSDITVTGLGTAKDAHGCTVIFTGLGPVTIIE